MVGNSAICERYDIIKQAGACFRCMEICCFMVAMLSHLIRWRLPDVHANSSLQVQFHLTQFCNRVYTCMVLSCCPLFFLYCKGFQEEFCNRGDTCSRLTEKREVQVVIILRCQLYRFMPECQRKSWNVIKQCDLSLSSSW